MLKNCLLVLTLAGLAYTVTPAIAQDSGSQAGNDQQQSAPAGEADHGGRRHFDPAMRTQRLTKELKLNSDNQQSKVLDITKGEQTQMESVRSDSSLSQQDRRAKMMDIHKTSDDQIRALLDANQQKKWDAMQTRREQWGHNHGGQGQQPPPDNSQPQ